MNIELDQTQLYYNYDKAFVDRIYARISMTGQDDAGNIITTPVPTVFATPERAFASIAQQVARRKGVVDPKTVDIKNIPLPFISVSRGDDVLDPKRYIRVKLNRLMYDKNTGTYMGVWLPQPMDLTYQVDVWARNLKDAESVKNQFLLGLRYNEFYLHVTHPMPFGPRIVLTELKGIQDNSKLENTNEQRVLRKTLTFTVHGWLCPQAEYADVIQRAIVDIDDNATRELLSRIVVTSEDLASPVIPVPVPPIEGAPTMSTSIYAALIPGAAEVGVEYGGFTAPSVMSITGLQAAVNGHAPQGSSLVLQIVLNGTALTAKAITIVAGDTRASVSFAAALRVSAGDQLKILCVSAGTLQPAEWVEIQYNAVVEITL